MMKTKTFFLLILFLPYLCWAVIHLLPITNPITDDNHRSSHIILDFFSLVFSIFDSSVWLWGIPYTLLVIGLLIWSKNQSIQRIYKAAFYAPFLLSALTAIEIMIVFIYLDMAILTSGTQSVWESLSDVLMGTTIFSGLAALVTLPYGYVFVSIGIMMYKEFVKLKLIDTKGEVMPSISSMIVQPVDQIRQKLAGS